MFIFILIANFYSRNIVFALQNTTIIEVYSQYSDLPTYVCFTDSIEVQSPCIYKYEMTFNKEENRYLLSVDQTELNNAYNYYILFFQSSNGQYSSSDPQGFLAYDRTENVFTGAIEYRFSNYSSIDIQKVTGNTGNSFVLTDSSYTLNFDVYKFLEVYQIPTSSVSKNNPVYIPLKYTLNCNDLNCNSIQIYGLDTDISSNLLITNGLATLLEIDNFTNSKNVIQVGRVVPTPAQALQKTTESTKTNYTSISNTPSIVNNNAVNIRVNNNSKNNISSYKYSRDISNKRNFGMSINMVLMDKYNSISVLLNSVINRIVSNLYEYVQYAYKLMEKGISG